jgi:hypothetical protein
MGGGWYNLATLPNHLEVRDRGDLLRDSNLAVTAKARKTRLSRIEPNSRYDGTLQFIKCSNQGWPNYAIIGLP